MSFWLSSIKVFLQFSHFFKCSSIYLTRQNNDEADYYDGSKWGLNFKITLSELDFYNSNKNNIIEKLNENFERIK